MSKVDGLQQIRRGAEEILVESELVDLLEKGQPLKKQERSLKEVRIL